MTHLIDKNALVAEIEKHYNECLKRAKVTDSDYWNAKADAYRNVLVILDDTLGVKEVDLEKEIDNYIYSHLGRPRMALELDWKYCDIKFKPEKLTNFARHFFELGMRVNNPITAADRGTAEEIIINLKRVEQDYRINLTREMEWLRNKVKKGE